MSFDLQEHKIHNNASLVMEHLRRWFLWRTDWEEEGDEGSLHGNPSTRLLDHLHLHWQPEWFFSSFPNYWKDNNDKKTNIFVYLSLQELDGCLEIHVADVLALVEGEDEVVVAMTRPVLHLLHRKRGFDVEMLSVGQPIHKWALWSILLSLFPKIAWVFPHLSKFVFGTPKWRYQN